MPSYTLYATEEEEGDLAVSTHCYIGQVDITCQITIKITVIAKIVDTL